MRLYQVDYELKNKDAFLASNVTLPSYVLAESLAKALTESKSYENENVLLYEVKCIVADKKIVIASTDAEG